MRTCTVDRKTFDELPDRSTLTGMPLPNQWYRDPREPDHVFQWSARDGQPAWQAYLWAKP